ncbi:MAG: DNA-deoxyinosine glycosylase [Eubacteriaceae bacterium]|jgi:TDG/mug DNA glycosylase family protein
MAARTEPQHLVHEIPPFVPDDARVLMLGSFPSPKSREAKFFYGHPQNRFWKVLAEVFEDTVPDTIDEKKAFLTRHHIALWDTIASCDIVGANDASIRNAEVNPIDRLLEKSGIRHVFTTGKASGRLYQKYLEERTGIQAVVLPSTSPANRAVTHDKILKAYQQVREAVNEQENGCITDRVQEEK